MAVGSLAPGGMVNLSSGVSRSSAPSRKRRARICRAARQDIGCELLSTVMLRASARTALGMRRATVRTYSPTEGHQRAQARRDGVVPRIVVDRLLRLRVGERGGRADDRLLEARRADHLRGATRREGTEGGGATCRESLGRQIRRPTGNCAWAAMHHGPTAAAAQGLRRVRWQRHRASTARRRRGGPRPRAASRGPVRAAWAASRHANRRGRSSCRDWLPRRRAACPP
eukprot:867879-Prymnesium_polylepis.1